METKTVRLRRRRVGPKVRLGLAAAGTALVCGLVGASTATGQAGALTVSMSGGTLAITGTNGEDDILFSRNDSQINKLRIASYKGPITITAGTPCTADEWDPGDIECTLPTAITVNLYGGDDSLSVLELSDDNPINMPMTVDAGPGDDFVRTGGGNDVIHGGPGNDRLTGDGGDDRIFGGDGNDTLNGDAPGTIGNDYLDGGAGDDEFETYLNHYPVPYGGNDTYIGGPGNDSFSYYGRVGPVTITLDGVANDGVAGEADNIHPDIESVGGSNGNDTIIGSDGPNQLWGGDGNDVIRGLGGDDVLSGDDGDDTVDGGAGNDQLTGGCDTDTLIGGPGADTFYSDRSPSSTCGFFRRSPLDRIEAADGEKDNLIFCQEIGDAPGDVAIVDAIDPVTNFGPGACSTITIKQVPGAGAPPPGSSPAPGTPGTKPAVAVRPAGTVRLRIGTTVQLLVGTGRRRAAAKPTVNLRTKRVTLGTYWATKRTRVTATATVRQGRRTIVIGRATTAVPVRNARPVTLRLTAPGQRALRKLKRARVTAAFKVGKKTYRRTYVVPVARR